MRRSCSCRTNSLSFANCTSSARKRRATESTSLEGVTGRGGTRREGEEDEGEEEVTRGGDEEEGDERAGGGEGCGTGALGYAREGKKERKR